jgi:hypothetical protein
VLMLSDNRVLRIMASGGSERKLEQIEYQLPKFQPSRNVISIVNCKGIGSKRYIGQKIQLTNNLKY